MITKHLMERCFPTAGLTSAKNLRKYNLIRERDALIAALNHFLPLYSIDTYNRVCAFFSATGVETDYYKTTSEYASGADYEGRAGLGNFVKGDGRAMKGSGLIQTTGRYNFWRVVVRFVHKLTGKDFSSKLANTNFKAYLASPEYAALIAEADRLGVNFLASPERLRDDMNVAVEAACIFWQENNLNKYADTGRIKELNSVVNRGVPNKTALGWDKRWELYLKVRKIIPANFVFEIEGENTDGAVPVVPVTPVSPVTGTPTIEQTVAPTVDAPEPEVKALDCEKLSEYSGSFQNPAVKTVAKKAGGRLLIGLGSVWGTTGGKIALILTVGVLLGVAGGLVYSYRKSLQLGYQIVKATVKKALGGIVS